MTDNEPNKRDLPGELAAAFAMSIPNFILDPGRFRDCLHNWKRTGERNPMYPPAYIVECQWCGVDARQYTNEDGTTDRIERLD